MHLARALMEHFLEGSAPFYIYKGYGKLTHKRRFVFVTLLIWVNVAMCLNRAIPSSKCSIKAPAE